MKSKIRAHARAKFYKHVKFMSAQKLVRAIINTFSRTPGAPKLVRAKINMLKVCL